MYRIGVRDAKGIGDAMHNHFVKAKRDLEVLSTTHGTLELHITKVNYKANIWLLVDYVIMYLENIPTEIIGWQESTNGQESK